MKIHPYIVSKKSCPRTRSSIEEDDPILVYEYLKDLDTHLSEDEVLITIEQSYEDEVIVRDLHEWLSLAEMHKQLQEEEKAHKEALDIVRKHMSNKFVKELMQVLEESEMTYAYAVVEQGEPTHPFHKENVYLDDRSPEELIYWYIHQYTNGGMTGDNFEGQVYIHLKDRLYFTFHYSM